MLTRVKKAICTSWVHKSTRGKLSATTIISSSTTNSSAKGQLMSELSYEGTPCLQPPSLQPLIPRPPCTDSWEVHPDHCFGQIAYKCSQDEVMLTTYREPTWSETKTPSEEILYHFLSRFYITTQPHYTALFSSYIYYYLKVFVFTVDPWVTQVSTGLKKSYRNFFQ